MMRIATNTRRPYLETDVNALQTGGMPGQPAADTFNVRFPVAGRHDHLRVLAPHVGMTGTKPPERPVDARQTGPAHITEALPSREGS